MSKQIEICENGEMVTISLAEYESLLEDKKFAENSNRMLQEYLDYKKQRDETTT